MGDSKVKVAVRVRPMNRRGETLLPQRPPRAVCEGVGPEGLRGREAGGARPCRCLQGQVCLPGGVSVCPGAGEPLCMSTGGCAYVCLFTYYAPVCRYR